MSKIQIVLEDEPDGTLSMSCVVDDDTRLNSATPSGIVAAYICRHFESLSQNAADWFFQEVASQKHEPN